MFSEIVTPDGLTFAVSQQTELFQGIEIYLDLFMKISKMLPSLAHHTDYDYHLTFNHPLSQ